MSKVIGDGHHVVLDCEHLYPPAHNEILYKGDEVDCLVCAEVKAARVEGMKEMLRKAQSYSFLAGERHLKNPNSPTTHMASLYRLLIALADGDSMTVEAVLNGDMDKHIEAKK